LLVITFAEVLSVCTQHNAKRYGSIMMTFYARQQAQ